MTIRRLGANCNQRQFSTNALFSHYRLFDLLATELRKVDSDLVFEFGPPREKRELIISAGGIKRAFPAVVSLVRAAPVLERWSIIAFRPRRWPISTVTFQGKQIDPKDVTFTLLDNGTIAGIYLFIPGCGERDTTLKSIGYLLLDEALGEYDVETRLGLIKMFSPEETTDGNRYPFDQLPSQFDDLATRLEQRSGTPS